MWRQLVPSHFMCDGPCCRHTLSVTVVCFHVCRHTLSVTADVAVILKLWRALLPSHCKCDDWLPHMCRHTLSVTVDDPVTLLTYLLTYLLTHLLTYLLAYLLSGLMSCLLTFLLSETYFCQTAQTCFVLMNNMKRLMFFERKTCCKHWICFTINGYTIGSNGSYHPKTVSARDKGQQERRGKET